MVGSIVRMLGLQDDQLAISALTAVGALRALIDFTLSNARRFYSSMGNPLAVKGLASLSKDDVDDSENVI